MTPARFMAKGAALIPMMALLFTVQPCPETLDYGFWIMRSAPDAHAQYPEDMTMHLKTFVLPALAAARPRVLAIAATASGCVLGLSACEPQQTAGSPAPPADQQASAAAPTAAQHETTGTIKGIDRSANTVSIAHEAVPGLGWPAMTMSFQVRDPNALAQIEEGQSVEFSFTEQSSGQYAITSISTRD